MKNKDFKGKIISQGHYIELKKLRVLNLSFNIIKNVFGVMIPPRKEVTILAKPLAWKYLLNNPVAKKDFSVMEMASYNVLEEKINLRGEVAEINIIDTERYLLGEMGAILNNTKKESPETKPKEEVIENKNDQEIVENSEIDQEENEPEENEVTENNEEKKSSKRRKRNKSKN